MIFNSYEFIFIFLPLVITLFCTLSRSSKYIASLWLVIASLVFYGSLSLHTLPLLVASVFVNYAISLLTSRSHSRLCLCIGLVFNFGLLGWCKFTGHLPLGISFYTFTQTAYLVDVYGGGYDASGFIDYVRHVTFFGCITSGPIARIGDTIPSFTVDYDAIAKGLTLFLLGLFKKVYMADGLANTVNTLFASSGRLNFSEAWLAALGYSVQLYFDFSGYSDMAIGIGLMFGMRLPQNFDSPYKSLSIIDFWRRWHMSLGAWIRDYIYIPLGGSREGELKRTRNVMIAMLFTGLWHGLGGTFIVWGALHGVLLAINHWWRRQGVRLPAILSWLLTFVCVVMLWVVFRAESLSDAWNIFAAMVDVKHIALPPRFGIYIPFLGRLGIALIPLIATVKNFAHVFIVLMLALLPPNMQHIMEHFRPNRVWIVVSLVLAIMSFMNFSGVSDFLYFQF